MRQSPPPANKIASHLLMMKKRDADFDHYVVTRFNVAVEFAQDCHLNPAWLAHRFELFEKFCLPSLAGQTTRDFTWILLVDAQTPAGFRDRLASALRQQMPKSEIVPCGNDFRSDFTRYVRGAGSSSHRHVITTRVDNDDALRRDFVARVQGEFSQQQYAFVEFIQGYTLVEASKELRSRAYPSNPFASLIEEKSEKLTTVFCGNHLHLKTIGPMISLAGPEMWLQVVHARNVCNKASGTLVDGAWDILQKEFNLNI